MALETWIIDTSAYHRIGNSPDAPLWEGRIHRCLVGITTVTLLEIGFSSRNTADYFQVFNSAVMSSLVPLGISLNAERAAMEIQKKLVIRGEHRGPSVSDLLVAAVAIEANKTVLHLDKDFETIRKVAGLTLERVSEV